DPGCLSQFIHKGLNGKNVGESPQAAHSRYPKRAVRHKMFNDALAREGIFRPGVAVTAKFRPFDKPGLIRREWPGQMPGRQQIGPLRPTPGPCRMDVAVNIMV